MQTLLRTILLLPCAFLASAEGVCSPPRDDYPEVKLKSGFSLSRAVYKCMDGYKAYEGSPVIHCHQGQWGNLTLKCQKKECGNAGELLNGHFQYEGESLLGDLARVICDDGYTVKGPAVIECGAAGWPKELPTCEEGVVTCSAPKVAHSEMKDFAHEYKVSEVVSVRCSPGFQIKGDGRIICGTDGQWEPPLPQCVPAAEKNDRCGVPDNNEFTNAMLAPKFSGKTAFPSKARVYYVCEAGYVHSRGSKYRRCNQGVWSPLELRCRKRLCGSAGELYNGHYEYTGVEFGDMATAVCDEGFQLVGQATRNCLKGGWDGHPPVCDVMSCDDPPEVDNAEVVGFAVAPYEYRTVVTYRCLVGTLIEPSRIWCRENGTWSSPLPQCRDVTCAPPNIPNASWVRSLTGRYQYRDSIFIQCNPRYTISGQPTITCGLDGQWAPELPKCKSTTAWSLSRRG